MTILLAAIMILVMTQKNGEIKILSILENYGAKIIFDVGANTGEWAVQSNRVIPGAKIFSFEISSETAELLIINKISDNHVINNIGLSNKNETVRYKDFGKNSPQNTLQLNSDFLPQSTLKFAQVVRGDDYCHANSIDIIDFLKIDFEGAENLVLEGFSGMLQKQSIRCIQFEYGYINVDTHFLFKDFWNFFDKIGYRVGRVWSDGVSFSDYHPSMNNFNSGLNYIAIRKSDIALIEALSIGNRREI